MKHQILRISRTNSKMLTSLTVFTFFSICPLTVGQEDPAAINRTFSLESKSTGVLFAKRYVRDDFELEATLQCVSTGVVFDTVGINAAPRGSFCLMVRGDFKVQFQVYDPRLKTDIRDANGWHILVSRSALTANVPARVIVRRQKGILSLSVNGKTEAQVNLDTPLSGDPIYIGDFPGDDRWGEKFNIHPAIIGKVTVHYAGAPRVSDKHLPQYPEVLDETGSLTETQIAAVGDALRKIKSGYQVSLGIVVTSATNVDTPEKRAAYRQRMIAQGTLPTNSGMFIYTGDSRFYERSKSVDAIINLEHVKTSWQSSTLGPSLVDRILLFLANLNRVLGGETLTSPSPPVVVTPPKPPDTSSSSQVQKGVGALKPVNMPPIPVNRLDRLTSSAMDARTGGTITTSDGLTIRVPGGNLDKTRTITVYKATAAPPAMALGCVGQSPQPLQPWRTWDIDAGQQTDLFPDAVEYQVDVKELRQPDGRYPLIQLATSIDGQRWTFLPYEVYGTKLVCHTRHFCPLTAYVGWKYIVALGAAIGAYMYARGWEGLKEDVRTELPSIFADKSGGSLPWNWVSLGPDARGFQVWWHVSIAGTRSGLANEAEFERQKGALEQDYLNALNKDFDWNSEVLTALRKRIEILRWQWLMPQKVKEINHALQVAAEYIESRNFKRPYLTLPVYVVQSAGGDCGRMQNPWLGRRYMVLSANQDTNDIYATALHELFHNYQSGYLWYTPERQTHLPVTEASALLMEREAIDHYANIRTVLGSTGVKIWTDVANMNVYKDGVFSSPEDLGKHGYGLSWFLEYLRDNGHAGSSEFHKRFFENWAAFSGTMFKAFVWAAGSGMKGTSEEQLGRRFLDFAKDYVLTGMRDKTVYGKQYSREVFKGDPHTDLDFAKQPVQSLTDQMIKPWSIQFYRLLPGGTPMEKLVVKMPEEWFTYKSPGRGVFMRQDETDTVPIAWEMLNIAKGVSKDAWLVMPFNVKRYLYIVDTGQSGSGWVSDYQPAQALVLAPPSAVKAELLPGGKAVRVTWKLSAAAQASDIVVKHFVYEVESPGKPGPFYKVRIVKVGTDTTLPVAESGGKETSVTFNALEVLRAAPELRVTSAVQVGVNAAGNPVYLESDRSDVLTLGIITGLVNLKKDEIDPKKIGATNPFATLEGFPVPDAQVILTFTVDGQQRKLYVTTNKTGQFSTTVPLNVQVTVEARGESKTVMCTPAQPRVGVAFGWGGHEITVTQTVETEKKAP